MKVDKISLNCTKISEPIAACIGYFDGLHLGHRALINKTIEVAKEKKVESALITFSPDPWVTIKGLTNVQHLTSEKRRIELAEKLGIDRVIILDFTKEMSELAPEEFINQVLIPCNLKALICGFDFHYGFKGAGNTETLKQNSSSLFDLVVIESINEEEKKISTTRITEYLESGEVEHANRLLGYPYEIYGEVVHGYKRGREIGFPTANVDVLDELIIPRVGVYAGWTIIDGIRYQSMINVGHNPTFNFSKKLSVESNIFDFDDQIYGKEIRIQFVSYLRDELKFDTIQELIDQMDLDKVKTIEVLSNE
ncbi:bifunctional riboflavin kinase/FAD synthetase [Anaerorhabdus furcosa]|uniref:Riboflavin biosynthesis protein n=1 Tax=Anaerorhabdus furcosa TaxID=118967 RepID=A0A1T4PCT6_9FIRM|nr:bifunctional riboflavin kinase/FAD synthetase [Anaerorhabdus furcosa]SJZ89309.1 riboflavin kinase / FMN adenylyltransferase [Anaerorhabdus furcosa]